MPKWLARGAVALPALLVVIQVIPYGRVHENPPVTAEPKWDSPEVRALAHRACFDCHSNETRWPWYSFVAPVSWFIANDVYGARGDLNFSEWNEEQEVKKAPKLVRKEAMPLRPYLWLHGDAVLTSEERERLARGLEALAKQAGSSEKKDH
ncbi:MAG TPA: heme-binding domain-containing protein [Polyangiaceae bacterium]